MKFFNNYLRRTRFWRYSLLFSAISFATYYIESNRGSIIGLDGFLIPDVVNMGTQLESLSFPDPAVSQQVRTAFPGIATLYGSAMLIHPIGALIVNIVLAIGCIYMVSMIFGASEKGGRWVCLGMMLNPYLFLAAAGPNKEIPTTLATLIVVYALTRRTVFCWTIAYSAAIFAYLFRDGYGLILLLLVAASAFVGKARYILFLFGSVIFITIAGLYGYGAGYSSVVARNIETASALNIATPSALGISTGGCGGVADVSAYGLRIAYNVLSLGVFPQLQTTGGAVFVLGIGYWIVGFWILAGTLSCCYVFVMKSGETGRISEIVLFLTMATSVSIYIQPRYLMPLIPLAFGVMVTNSIIGRKVFVFSLAIVVAFVIFYWLHGKMPAPADTSDMANAHPSFLLPAM